MNPNLIREKSPEAESTQLKKHVIGNVLKLRKLTDAIKENEDKYEGIEMTPEMILSIATNQQASFLESEEAQNLKASEYCDEQMVLLALFGLQTAKAQETMENPDARRKEVRTAKKILAEYNKHMHDTMFYAKGVLAKRFVYVCEMLNAAFSNELGVTPADKQTIRDSFSGVKYEVACHRALAYPSHIKTDGKDIPYEVSASSVEDDLAGVDILLDFQSNGEEGHFLYGFDVKKRGSFQARADDMGRRAVSTFLGSHFIDQGVRTINGRDMHRDVICAEDIEKLEGERIDFSEKGKHRLRKLVFERVSTHLQAA